MLVSNRPARVSPRAGRHVQPSRARIATQARSSHVNELPDHRGQQYVAMFVVVGCAADQWMSSPSSRSSQGAVDLLRLAAGTSSPRRSSRTPATTSLRPGLLPHLRLRHEHHGELLAAGLHGRAARADLLRSRCSPCGCSPRSAGSGRSSCSSPIPSPIGRSSRRSSSPASSSVGAADRRDRTLPAVGYPCAAVRHDAAGRGVPRSARSWRRRAPRTASSSRP